MFHVDCKIYSSLINSSLRQEASKTKFIRQAAYKLNVGVKFLKTYRKKTVKIKLQYSENNY